LGAIEEVQFFQLPIIKKFLEIGLRGRLAWAPHDATQPSTASSAM